MDDYIKLTCPRCKNNWKKSLNELERFEDIFRSSKGKEEPNGKIARYRTQCPVCGTYVVITVQED